MAKAHQDDETLVDPDPYRTRLRTAMLETDLVAQARPLLLLARETNPENLPVTTQTLLAFGLI